MPGNGQLIHDDDVMDNNEVFREQESHEIENDVENDYQEPVEDQEPITEVESDVEKRAKELGWVPKDQFRGRPDNHIDAETFVQRRTDEFNSLKDENRDLRRSFDELKKQIAQRDRTYAERDINKVKEQRLKAVQDGDIDAFNHYEREIETINKQVPTYEPERAEPQIPDEVRREVDRFVGRNEWYEKDAQLQKEAQVRFGIIEQTYPNLTIAEKLNMTEQEMRRMYPKATGTQRGVQRPIEAGARPPLKPRTGRKTAADLPSEMRSVAELQVQQGIFKDIEEYAKYYWQ